MYVVTLVLSLFFFDKTITYDTTINITDAQEVNSCEELLSTEQYKNIERSYIEILKHTYGIEELTIERRECFSKDRL